MERSRSYRSGQQIEDRKIQCWGIWRRVLRSGISKSKIWNEFRNGLKPGSVYRRGMQLYMKEMRIWGSSPHQKKKKKKKKRKKNYKLRKYKVRKSSRSCIGKRDRRYKYITVRGAECRQECRTDFFSCEWSTVSKEFAKARHLGKSPQSPWSRTICHRIWERTLRQQTRVQTR